MVKEHTRTWGFEIRKTTRGAAVGAVAHQARKQLILEQLTAERDEEQARQNKEWEHARFLPDLSQGNGKKDGKMLLSDTSLKIVNGRRYGLVGS
ncbi:ABCF/EF-3b transporter [Phytophthora megakarya]|uniref:ABCF/EF-3b transporter n=1 Tax=Phytophthora megakarya TaxID=4795 RepID=A0A225WZA7_9STRA|nr:ABCF/EF-3b transporter [Phytophthora megakarya]